MIDVQRGAEPARLRANVARENIDNIYTARLAITAKTRRDAYRIRHSSYLNSGYIDPRPDGLFSDEYDLQPTSQTAVVYKNDRPLASVRVSFFSYDTLESAPIGTVYAKEVGELLVGLPSYAGRYQAAEVNRLARSPEAENDQALVFLLLRAAGYLAIQQNVLFLMSCVRQNHVAFYRRIGCYVASEPRPYSGIRTTNQLLVCPRARYDEACAAFPIMDPRAGQPGSFDGFMSGRAVMMPLHYEE